MDRSLTVRALLLLKLGRPPQDVADAVEGVQEDLLATTWPEWLKPVRDSGVDRDQLNQLLAAVEANSDLLPAFN